MTNKSSLTTIVTLCVLASLAACSGGGGASAPTAPYLLLSANNGTSGLDLFRSDGTAAGTTLVKDINTKSDANPGKIAVINGVSYFSATDGSNGTELWKLDVNGATMVKDIAPGSASSNPLYLTVIGSTLYFIANDGIN